MTERFAEEMAPMFFSIHILRLRDATLSRTCDLLLPKLVSGEMDVEGMDLLIPAQTSVEHIFDIVADRDTIGGNT